MKATLITPSYAGDAERCAVLCESVDRFMDPDINHVLIVPRRDRGLFEAFKSPVRTILDEEDVLPRWMVRVPGLRHPWRVTPFSPPVRGWIAQQIMKLQSDRITDRELLIYADSDVALVRPVRSEHFVQGDKVRLYHHPDGGRLESHFRWHRSAARLLALPARSYSGSDYICQMVSWRRSVLLDLQAHIARVAGLDWRKKLCRELHFSECILYGIFATEEKKGLDSRHYLSDQDFSHSSWHYDLGSPEGIRSFAASIKPQHLAVHVQSNLRLDIATHRQIVTAATHVANA